MESAPTTTESDRRTCDACGAQLSRGARYCHRCGTAVGAGVPGATPTSPVALLPWGVAALALIALISLLAGQFFARSRRVDSGVAAAAAEPGTIRAPDISSMSAQERADRLFERVMRYDSQGQADSAQFFAPMALAALEAVTPRTNDTRYDFGRVALVAGDPSSAAAQADTILRESPTHLLGLILGALAADAKGDRIGRREFEKRLVAAEPAERARALPEYTDHNRDIDAMLSVARGRKP